MNVIGIGNVGAWPVFASHADVPAGLKRPGMRYAVALGGGLYQGVVVGPARDEGLGIALAPAIAAGSAAGPVGTLIGIGVAVLPMVGKLLGGLFNRGPSQQERASADQFEAMAAETTQLFNQIQAKSVITAADYHQAANKYNQLASAAQQLGAVSYVAQKWADPNYNQAYQARLAQIRAAAEASITSSGAAGSTLGLQVGATMPDNTTLLLGAAGLALVFMLTR